MSRNYFKVGKDLFFFDDSSALSARTSYTLAALHATDENPVAVWRMPRLTGPWSNADLIGHRRRANIMADFAEAERAVDDPNIEPRFREIWERTLADLEEELERLNNAA